jgi:NAD(P)-dependent dehydrogenase (short-subunit alcohol dehydrogenase family)
MDLTGRTAIVTGASRGIGLAAAGALVSAGANVVLTSRRQEDAVAAAEPLGARAVGYGAHAADAEAAAECMSFTVKRFGRLDILVNNAGTNPAFGPLIQQNRARFEKAFEINLWAPLMWTGLACRMWMAAHGGAVINNASLGGLVVEQGLGVYNASKAALIHLTRHLALELAPRVRVNAVAPGIVRTRLAEALWKEHEPAVVAQTPLGRIGEPSDIAGAIVFLASDHAAWITGETLIVDGGQRLAGQAQDVNS